jgi:hypothetical protein
MPRPIHLEIPADNPDRAVKFYEQTFGWEFQLWAGPTKYWLFSSGDAKAPGIDGGLLERNPMLTGPTATLDVADVDAACAAVVKNGGTIVAPKFAAPGIGWLAYFKDPEGNLFGMIKEDQAAK